MNEAAKMIRRLEPSKQEYLQRYFSSAPQWLREKLQPVRLPAGTVFLHEGEPASQVMVLLEGRVTAVDYRVQEAVYGFFHFYPVEFFGVMEIVGGIDRYKTSLAALEDCLFLRVGREDFEQWLKNDRDVFRLEAGEIVRSLLEQARKERLYVLLSGNERIYLVLINLYEAYAKEERYSVYVSRKDFAEMTGLSERTITRTIKRLEADGYLTKEGWNITLTRNQYLRLRRLIDGRLQIL